ncbi:MAG: helix-turn-helix domain-containing protein [Smithella sp.]
MSENSFMTIREINKYADENNLSKTYKSYTTIYNLIKSGCIPVTKLGNRYLLRICDIENYLTGQAAPVSDGIRRID